MRKRSLSRQSSQRISLHGRKRHRTFRKSRYEALEDRHLLAHPAATTNFSVNDTWAQIGQDIDGEASLQNRAEEETRSRNAKVCLRTVPYKFHLCQENGLLRQKSPRAINNAVSVEGSGTGVST